MTTITLCAWRRPDYTRRVLKSITNATAYFSVVYRGWPSSQFAQTLIISVDGGSDPDVLKVIREWRGGLFYGIQSIDVVEQTDHLGVSENPRFLLNRAFNMLQSDFNLDLQDDTVLSPDAFLLAEWYRRNHAHKYLSLGLHRHSQSFERPAEVIERADFGVWGWCTTRRWWEEVIRPTWDHKVEEPLGWDWSLSHTMHQRKLFGLQPVLSRVANIGREGGFYQTPEGYDEEMRGDVAARSSDSQSAFTLSEEKAVHGAWKWGA